MKSKLKSNKIFDLAERCHYQHALRTSHSFCMVFTTLSVAGQPAQQALGLVGTGKNRRARRKHAGGEVALACLPRARPFSLSPLLPSACYAGQSQGYHQIPSTVAPSDTSWNLHNVVFLTLICIRQCLTLALPSLIRA